MVWNQNFKLQKKKKEKTLKNFYFGEDYWIKSGRPLLEWIYLMVISSTIAILF